MLRGVLLSLTALVFSARAVQVPLQSNYRWQDNPKGILGVDKPTQWSLDEIPNSNATDHLVFETVYSLLQQWPNHRMKNGMRSVFRWSLVERTLSPRP